MKRQYASRSARRRAVLLAGGASIADDSRLVTTEPNAAVFPVITVSLQAKLARLPCMAAYGVYEPLLDCGAVVRLTARPEVGAGEKLHGRLTLSGDGADIPRHQVTRDVSRFIRACFPSDERCSAGTLLPEAAQSWSIPCSQLTCNGENISNSEESREPSRDERAQS